MNEWIVVVDDEAISLNNVRELLGSENMRVSCLRSGRDLIKFMEKNKPDLILLDLMMPDMDGFGAYHMLRKFEDSNGQKHTPVIFLTGENDNDKETQGLKLGASDYVRKPFDKNILVNRIYKAINNKKTIETLAEEALIDKLTGFYNKVNGTEKIKDKCAISEGALMIVDLDSFKLVNDLYGHTMGDNVLKAFSDILRWNLRNGDLVSRIGGDEFLVFFEDITQEISVGSIVKKINEQLIESCKELMGENFGIPIGVSVGIAFSPTHSTEYDKLFHYADISLYKVKQNGKHGYEIYHPNENSDSETDLDYELVKLSRIVEERGDGEGGLYLSKEAFSNVYQYIRRYNRRYGNMVYEILFVIKDCTMLSPEQYQEITSSFAELLQKKLRAIDVFMQTRADQFFVVLPGFQESKVSVMIDSILAEWNAIESSKKVNVSYATSVVYDDI
ncbi:MAG: diguanylate cyclase [Lachnospiraceae bacterium]|nr:diguanylate cyclase [Lachnospiraceae bacterium]